MKQQEFHDPEWRQVVSSILYLNVEKTSCPKSTIAFQKGMYKSTKVFVGGNLTRKLDSIAV